MANTFLCLFSRTVLVYHSLPFVHYINSFSEKLVFCSLGLLWKLSNILCTKKALLKMNANILLSSQNSLSYFSVFCRIKQMPLFYSVCKLVRVSVCLNFQFQNNILKLLWCWVIGTILRLCCLKFLHWKIMNPPEGYLIYRWKIASKARK